MKRRPRKFALLLLVPLALYAFISERNSWRPKTIVVPNAQNMGPGLDWVEFSPDGRLLVVEDSHHGPNSEVLLFNTTTHQIIQRFKAANSPYFLNNNLLSVWEQNEKQPGTKIYSVTDRKLISSAPKQFQILTALPGNRTLLGWKVGEKGDVLHAWDWHSSKTSSFYFALPDFNCSFWPLADRRTVAVVTLATPMKANGKAKERYDVQFWDIVTKKLRFHINQSTGDVFAIASTAKGLCALWFEGRIEIWNYKTGQYVKKISDSRIKEFQPQAIIGFATDMTANGALLALSARDANDIGLWDINTGHFIRFLKGHTSGINALKFSPDGRTLASCSDDGTIKLWRIK